MTQREELLYLLTEAHLRGFSDKSVESISSVQDAYKAIGIDLEARLLVILRNMLGDYKNGEFEIGDVGNKKFSERLSSNDKDNNSRNNSDGDSGDIGGGSSDFLPDLCSDASEIDYKPINMLPIPKEKIKKFRKTIKELNKGKVFSEQRRPPRNKK